MTKKGISTFSTPVSASTAQVSRSMSGIVSSRVGASMVRQKEQKLLVNSMPESRISCCRASKMAISLPEDRSAVFIRLW